MQYALLIVAAVCSQDYMLCRTVKCDYSLAPAVVKKELPQRESPQKITKTVTITESCTSGSCSSQQPTYTRWRLHRR